MNTKDLLIYFTYELLYWLVWLGFIYGIIKLSNNLSFLWLLIVPCLMSKTVTSRREDKESDGNDKT